MNGSRWGLGLASAWRYGSAGAPPEKLHDLVSRLGYDDSKRPHRRGRRGAQRRGGASRGRPAHSLTTSPLGLTSPSSSAFLCVLCGKRRWLMSTLDRRSFLRLG